MTSIVTDNVSKTTFTSSSSLTKSVQKKAFGESGIYSPGLFSLKDSPLVKRTLPSSRRAPTPYMKAAKNRLKKKEKEIMMSLEDEGDMDVAMEESDEKILNNYPNAYAHVRSSIPDTMLETLLYAIPAIPDITLRTL